MIRRKPIETLEVPGYLGINPEKGAGFFVESTQMKNVFSKPPNCDSAGDSFELLAIENDLELKNLRKIQQEMLSNAEHQGHVNRVRIAHIIKMQRVLRERFAQVNANLKICDDKKIKAAQIINREKLKHEELKQVIKNRSNGIEVLKQFRNDLFKTVEEMAPYETGIKDVVAQTTGFSSVKDCTDRCDALMLVQSEISQMKNAKLLEIERKRQEMANKSKEAALTILGYLNELSQLERDYYKAIEEVRKWEKILVNIKNCIVEAKLDHKRILDGIRLLHRDLCNRRKIVPLTLPTEQLLDFIREEIRIIQSVVEECNKKKA